MPLLDTATLMQGLGLRTGDPQTVAYYDLLRRMGEAALISYVKWPVLGISGSVDYYDGQASQDLPLRYPFTSSIASVYLDNLGQYGQVTNSFGATTLLTLGTDYAFVIDGGGQASQPGQVSKSARLVMLDNALFWFPSDFMWYRASGGLGYRRPAVWPKGLGNIKVTSSWGFQNGVAVTAVAWSNGIATFTTATPHLLWATQTVTVSNAVPAGWNADYTVIACPSTTTFTASAGTNYGTLTTNGSLNSVPLDIRLALIGIVGQLRGTVKYGGPITSESGGKYNASVQVGMDPLFGTVRQLLSPYRNTPVGFA